MRNFKFLFLLFLLTGQFVLSQNQLTNIPTFYITTINNAPINSTEIYVQGFLTVVSADTTESFKDDTIQIKGRGNSTWSFAKKPYRIKLNKKRNLLNMDAKAKDWVLLANHADKTLIRNAVAFEIGKYLGMAFTPSVRFADVVLNGNYIGNYMITDQVEVGGDRVEVEKMDSTNINEPEVSGGYLLEIDGFANREISWFSSSKGVDITIKYPKDDEIVKQQKDYIINFTNSFESLLFGTKFTDMYEGYKSMIDTTSFIDLYIASELTGNPDCFWSTYLYKKRSDPKFYYGPMWDYDIAFNNDYRLGDALNKRMITDAFENKTWIKRQWTDKWFIDKVNQRWAELLKSGIVSHLQSYTDSLVTLLDKSQKLNFEKWPVINKRVYNEQFLFSTYAEGVDFLKKYINDRSTFLTMSFIQDEPVIPGKPFEAENFYYLITNKQVRNVIDITGQSKDINAKLMLWDPIEGKLSQQWKIKEISDGKFQFVNRYSGLAMKGAGRVKNLIQVQADEKSDSQLWSIVPESSGTAFRLDNIGSGLTADCSGGSSANGTAVIEYEIKASGSDNQYWYLQKVDMVETSVERIKNADYDFIIYPNPVSDLLYLSHTSDIQDNCHIEIFSSQGLKMIDTYAETNDIRIDVSGFTEGIYLLKANVNGKIIARKFVKK